MRVALVTFGVPVKPLARAFKNRPKSFYSDLLGLICSRISIKLKVSAGAAGGHLSLIEGKTLEDLKMEDGRWKMEDGRWMMEDGRWKMNDGR